MVEPLLLIQKLCRRALGLDDVQALLEELNAAAMEAVGGDRAFIALANNDTGELSLVAMAGDGWTDEFRARRLKITDNPAAVEAAPGSGDPCETCPPRTGITSHV